MWSAKSALWADFDQISSKKENPEARGISDAKRVKRAVDWLPGVDVTSVLIQTNFEFKKQDIWITEWMVQDIKELLLVTQVR